jgi:hypothetical protein
MALPSAPGVFDDRKVLGTKFESFDIAPSYTATLGRYLGRDAENNDWFLEASYWGLNQWELDTRVNATQRLTFDEDPEIIGGDLFIPFRDQLGGFNRLDTIEAHYDHSINNVELNCWIRPRARADRLVLQPNGRWVRQCQPGCYVGYMVGLRSMFIDDGFAMQGRGTLEIDGEDEPIADDYSIETNNRMIGFQLGGDVTFRHCRWSWGGKFRAAPFVNLADQESRIATDRVVGDEVVRIHRFREAEDEVAAVAIELGVGADYRLRPHCVARIGYDLMWVPGVALAPDQIDFDLNAWSDLNTGATLFYHGLTMSLNFAW